MFFLVDVVPLEVWKWVGEGMRLVITSKSVNISLWNCESWNITYAGGTCPVDTRLPSSLPSLLFSSHQLLIVLAYLRRFQCQSLVQLYYPLSVN